MANIKLINYPYKDFQIGDICDFGEAKNKSLVSLQRAVWLDEPLPISNNSEEITKDVVEDSQKEEKEMKTLEAEQTEEHKVETPIANTPVDKSPAADKKFLQNKTKDKIQSKVQKADSKSFWDRLK